MSGTVPPYRLAPIVRQNIEPSATLDINERVQARWASGQTVYHLGFGESRFPVHPKIQAALRANAHQRSYLPGQGLLQLREQVAAFYSKQLRRTVSAAEVMVGPGSKSLIFALKMALDAELLLPTPSWVSYAAQAQLLGKSVQRIPASPQDNYALTLSALAETALQSQGAAKILVLNSPSNPTGHMLEPSLLHAIADFCRREQILVLSDEIYSLVPHGHPPHVSIAQYYPEGTVVLGSLSKHLSLGGWRLGVAVLPPGSASHDLMLALRTIASEIWSTPSAPVQYAAVVAYSNDPELAAYIDQCARLHAIRTQHFCRGLTEVGISCGQPQGGFYLFANFDRWRESREVQGVKTSPDLAAFLLEEYQLATLPGTVFGTPPGDLSLRLATSYLDMEDDLAAERILASFRANADPEALMRDHHPTMNEAIGRFRQFVSRL